MKPLSLPKESPLITLSRPKQNLWIIELHNGQDARLTATLVEKGLMPAFDEVERQWREGYRVATGIEDKSGASGALIIVGRRDQDKFFSNGLDFVNSSKDPNFFPITFNPMLHRLLSFPIPTIAAINGHCFAGGFMLSLTCDYRVMTDGSSRNAWLCMNEINFGAVWPTSFAAILKAKVGDDRVRRKIALEAHRFTPQEALDAGILDHIVKGNTASVLKKAEEVADTVGKNAQSGVWGLIKNDLYRETLSTIQAQLRVSNAAIEDAAARARL
ncbi:ClpP/crotonase-like domain-containing protein [Mycena floridula]|nr:ClpP/crotonase-like domain-containing protein [Mycena floridula]